MRDPKDRSVAIRLTVEQLEELWTASAPVIAAYIRGEVANRHDAEDVLQEVGKALVLGVDRYDSSRPFVNWAFGIARNQILRYYQSRSNDKALFDTEMVEALAGAFEKLIPVASARRGALDECIKHLKTNQRLALEMYYSNEMTQAEIAEEFGMTKTAIGVLLHRTRLALKDCISRRLDRATKAQS